MEKKLNRLILALSILLPLVVVALFRIKIEGYNTWFLPPIYATINAITAILLVYAFIAIKNKRIDLHERLIKICMSLSVLFLLLYVIRHATSGDVKFGDSDGDGTVSAIELAAVGSVRFVYYFLLLTHILLSALVIPFVLFAFKYGILRQIEKHKKIVKFALPIWLYVAVSGVIVYLMISPYY